MAKKKAPDFSELDTYVEAWGLPTQDERMLKRLNTSIEELREFHDAMIGRLDEIIELLNGFPLHDIRQEYKKLSYAALAMCEVDDPVNKWKATTLPGAVDPRRFTVKKNNYDNEPVSLD